MGTRKHTEQEFLGGGIKIIMITITISSDLIGA